MADLICVTKDGEILEVHPDALREHRKLGWREIERPAPEPVCIESEDSAPRDSVQDTEPAVRPGRPRKIRIVEGS